MLKVNLSFIIALGAKNGNEGNNGCVFQCVLNFAGTCSLIPVLLFLIEEKEEKGRSPIVLSVGCRVYFIQKCIGHGIVPFSKLLFIVFV